MPEEDKRRWEISAPTTRPRCYPGSSRVKLALNQACRHLLTIINPEHRHSKPVQGFHQSKGPFTCHESHFSDLRSYECPMTPKTLKYQPILTKAVAVSALSRQSLAGYVTT